MIGGRAEPLAAIYPKGAHVDLVAALSGLDFSLQTVTQRLVDAGKLRPVSVKKKDQYFFQNINEPADLYGGRSSATPINPGTRRSSPLQPSPRQTDG